MFDSRSVARRAFLLAVPLTIAPAFLLSGTAGGAVSRSCVHAGDRLVAASPHIRVVRRRLSPADGFARQRFIACWRRSGTRTSLGVATRFGIEYITRTDVTIVGDRYVGVRMDEFIGPAQQAHAAIYDARKARRLHNTQVCGDTEEDYSGVQEVVFLAGGGMAFSCDRLLLYRHASSRSPIELEPPGTFVDSLAVSGSPFSSRGPALYWRVLNETGDLLAVNSVPVGG